MKFEIEKLKNGYILRAGESTYHEDAASLGRAVEEMVKGTTITFLTGTAPWPSDQERRRRLQNAALVMGGITS